jgi:iron complex transport system substrate-binding protein
LTKAARSRCSGADRFRDTRLSTRLDLTSGDRIGPGTPDASRPRRSFGILLNITGIADASLRLLFAGMLATICAVSAIAGRTVVDSAQRRVEVPDRIERVVAAGPPASVLLTILAPERWSAGIDSLCRRICLIFHRRAHLPEIGRLTGRGGTANLEVVMAAKPDLIIDFGSVSDTYVSLADRVQNQTGIPYILIDGRFANTLSAVQLLGNILGVDQRAGELTRRMEEILSDVDRAKAAVPPEARPRVYLARGNRGLETGNRGSINTEIIERAGAINVVDGGPLLGGLTNVSLEQVVAWNPDTIVTVDPSVADYIRSEPSWSQIDAVRRGRVFLSPRLPYGWVDSPPSLNRVMAAGVAGCCIPNGFEDLRTSHEFLKKFYC